MRRSLKSIFAITGIWLSSILPVSALTKFKYEHYGPIQYSGIISSASAITNIILFITFVVVLILLVRLAGKSRELTIKLNCALSELNKKESVINDLKESNTLKEKYFRVVSHSIKNPFTSLVGYSDMLLDEYDFLSNEERMFYIKLLRESIDTSLNRSQNIFSWINYMSGRHEYKTVLSNISDLVTQNIKQLQSYANRKNIHIGSEIELDLHSDVDPVLLNITIRNLLHNAIKYTPDDGKILVRVICTGGIIQITIQDTGIGITDSIKEKIHLKQSRNRFTKNEQISSSGLGLTLIKEFVTQNKGELWFESEVNQGSTFTFTLNKVNSKSSKS